MVARWLWWQVGAALLGAVLGFIAFAHLTKAPSAQAHPLGNFTVNRYSLIELTGDGIRLRYVIDLAEIPAYIERDKVDADGDGRASDVEREDYLESKADALRDGLRFTVDGESVQLRPENSELSFPPGQGGLDTQRVVIDFAAPVPDAEGALAAEYRDENARELAGWREVVVRPLDDVRLLASSAPSVDVSNQLRSYPEAGLSKPINVSGASFRFEVAPGALAAAEQPVAETERVANSDHDRAVRGNPDSTLARYASLIAKDELSAGVIVVALLAAVGFGALHALSPGHGKTVVAAYLVGSRGTARHTLLLGLTVTATHTSSVYALGFVTLYFSEYILPEDLYPWLGVVSGGVILAMGLALLAGRLRSSRLVGDALGWARARFSAGSSPATLPAVAGGANGRDPQDSHEHGPGSHHHRPSGSNGQPVTWRSLVALGIFGGLLPCPSAIVVMLSAVALHRVAVGLLLIVAFSVGLAAALTAIGFALVYAGRVSDRAPLLRRLAARSQSGGFVSMAARAFPVGSAAVVVAAGLLVTMRALIEQGLL